MSTYNSDQVEFEVKEDYFGLGYKRLDVGNLFGKGEAQGKPGVVVQESPAASLLFPNLNPNEKKINKKGFSGHVSGRAFNLPIR